MPQYRQSVIYGREGAELDGFLLDSWLTAASVLLRFLGEALRRHYFAAAQLHAGRTCRCLYWHREAARPARRALWTYMRDDARQRRRGAARRVFAYSPDQRPEH